MKSLVPCCILALTLSTAVVANDSDLPLKDIGPSVDAILSAERADETELAYVGARGAALFMAISKWLDENPGGERDKQISKQLMERAQPFFVVAHLYGALTGKAEKNTDAQIVLLMDTYLLEMKRSKQLNNEILSAPISRDLKAFEKAAPIVNGLVKRLEASNTDAQPSKDAKP